MTPQLDTTALILTVTPMICADEGCRLEAYKDTLGNWTIGWGRSDPGVTEGMTCSQEEADAWRDGKIDTLITALDTAIPWWQTLDIPRQAVLVDMAYEMGVHGLLGFANALEAMQGGNFNAASARLLMSRWADQVPARAARLAQIMKTGALPE